MLAPLGNILIFRTFEVQRHPAYMGYGTLIMNAGGIMLQMTAGFLAEINWHAAFLTYLYSLVALLLAAFIPEPKNIAEKNTIRTDKKGWLISAKISVMLFLFNMFNNPVIINMSVLVKERDLGGAAVTAVILSVYTLTGCVVGMVFGVLFKHIRRYCLTLGYVSSGLGNLLLILGNDLFFIFAGTILFGFGFTMITTTYFTKLGQRIPAEHLANAISAAMVFMNLGAFFSTFWIRFLKLLFGEAIRSAMLMEMILCLTIALFYIRKK